MEIEIRLPGPDDPFAPPKPRPEDLGPDDLGNKGVLRAGLEDQAKQMRAEFAEIEDARRKAEEEIELERAGIDLTLEGLRLAGLPDDEGAQESDPLRAFADFAKQRIAALPEGARDDAALHAGQERLKLDRAWRGRRHNAQVRRLQTGVDRSLEALTAQAAREPGRVAELAERGFALLQATGEGLRFDETQNKTVRGRFGRSLAEAALRAMAPKQALAALESGAIAALLPDAAVRETLRSDLRAAEANERRALKAETAGLMSLHLARLDQGEPGAPEIDRDVEIDFGAEEARAFGEQAEAARQRHRMRQQWRLAPEAEIAAGLEALEAKGDPNAARTVAEEIRARRQRDPAATVAEDPKLQALLVAAEDDPAQRELAASVSLELQKELGIPEGDRRVLTQQGLADLTDQIEVAPPAQRAALLQQVKESYGAHYDGVLSELEGARLDPTILALARRLDDPVAAHRLAALQGKTRTSLTEGIDPAEADAVAEAARAAVPGPRAPVAERVALARYRQTGDQDDAVALARDTVGEDALAGGDGEDDIAETESGSGITFGPEDVEDDPQPEDPRNPSEGFEAQAPDATTFAVTRADDGSLVFTDPASGEERTLPSDFVAAVEAATAGDPALRDLVLRIAVEVSLVESGGFTGEGTSESERRAVQARLDAAIETVLGPDDGPNARTIRNLRLAVQRSLRATNQRDKLFHIGRDALPEAHRAAVLESAKRFGVEAADVLTDLLPVVGEVKAGLRARDALRAYEAALEAGDTEAAQKHLLAFGEALTELAPGGKLARAGRVIPGLDRLKAKIGRLAADLLGAGTLRNRRAGDDLAFGMVDGKGREPGKAKGSATEVVPDSTPKADRPPPLQPTVLDGKLRARATRDLDEIRHSGELNVLRPTTSRQVNEDFTTTYKRARTGPDGVFKGADPHPPYDPTLPVLTGRTAHTRQVYIRVFGPTSSPTGSWLMRKQDFDRIQKSANPEETLKDLFAIPGRPTLFQEVTLPKDTPVRIGIAGGNSVWGKGGGLQIQIEGGIKEHWFGVGQRIRK